MNRRRSALTRIVAMLHTGLASRWAGGLLMVPARQPATRVVVACDSRARPSAPVRLPRP
jgi:putative copper export protein